MTDAVCIGELTECKTEATAAPAQESERMVSKDGEVEKLHTLRAHEIF